MHAKIPKLNCGAGSVSNKEDEYKDSNSYYEFSFDLIALDTFKNISNEDIGLVKIDVEGHELEAFKGMKSLLKKNKPIILFEQNRGIINGSSDEIEFLENIGYKFDSWNGDCFPDVYDSRICNIIMNSSKIIYANFVVYFELKNFMLRNSDDMVIETEDCLIRFLNSRTEKFPA
jgi:hypothetical protein